MEWAQSLVAGFRQLSQGTLCALYALFGFLQILVPPFPGDILLFLGGGQAGGAGLPRGAHARLLLGGHDPGQPGRL